MNSMDPLVYHGYLHRGKPSKNFFSFSSHRSNVRIMFIIGHYFNNSMNSTNSMDPLVYHGSLHPRDPLEKIDQFFEPSK